MTYVIALCLAGTLLAAPAPSSASKAAPPQGDAEPLPTVADAQKAFDAGDPNETLRITSKLLSLRGKSAQGADRYALFMLKGAAHLRLRAGDAAAQAFHQAAEHTDDREKAAVARATEQLIRRSRGLLYTPKRGAKEADGKPADPIDITNPDGRKNALRATFIDDMADLAVKLRAAKGAKTLAPALKALQSARELASIELAVNGSADQVNGIADDLKQSSRDLLERVLDRTTRRVDQITQMASDPEQVRQVIPLPQGGFDVQIAQRTRGIKRQDIGELKGLADTCDEVAAGGRAVARAAGVDENEFEALINDAEDLRMHIRRMLRAHDVEY